MVTSWAKSLVSGGSRKKDDPGSPASTEAAPAAPPEPEPAGFETTIAPVPDSMLVHTGDTMIEADPAIEAETDVLKSTDPPPPDTTRKSPDTTRKNPAGPPAGLSMTKRKQLSVTEMLAYVKVLGIDPIKEPEYLWIAEEALNAPLPPTYTEHVDENDTTYYFNTCTGESTWQNPMEELFKDVVDYQRRVVETSGFWLVEDEISEMQAKIKADMADWSELFDANGEKFYFNRKTTETRLDDPKANVYHYLYARVKLVAKMKERLPVLARTQRPDEREIAVHHEMTRRKALEGEAYINKICTIQKAMRICLARKHVKRAKAEAMIDKGPQPLKGKLRLRMEKTVNGGGELVLSMTTPHRRAKAATKIQARIRGYLTRRQFRPLVLHRLYQSKVITHVQARARVFLAKREMRRRLVRRRNRAVTTVSRIYRGYRDRQYIALLRGEKAKFQWMMHCIIRIQATVRMWLAKKTLDKRKIVAYGDSVLTLQAQVKIFRARSMINQRRIHTEPVQAVFALNHDERTNGLIPWSFQLFAAPWVNQDEETAARWTRGKFADLFVKAGFDGWRHIAATTIQRFGRGMLSRNRVRDLRDMGTCILNIVMKDVEEQIDLRQKQATKLQKVAKGKVERNSGEIKRRRQEFLRRNNHNIKVVQAFVKRDEAMEKLQEIIMNGERSRAASKIQACWQGYLVRKHYRNLQEEALWPVKSWFEYFGTSKDHVQVEVRFLPNMCFDDFKFFCKYGRAEELQDDLRGMEAEVMFAADSFLTHPGGRASFGVSRRDSKPDGKQGSAPTSPSLGKPPKSPTKGQSGKSTSPAPKSKPAGRGMIKEADSSDGESIISPTGASGRGGSSRTSPAGGASGGVGGAEGKEAGKKAKSAARPPAVAQAMMDSDTEEEDDDLDMSIGALAASKPASPTSPGAPRTPGGRSTAGKKEIVPRERSPIAAESHPSLAHAFLIEAPVKWREDMEKEWGGPGLGMEGGFQDITVSDFPGSEEEPSVAKSSPPSPKKLTSPKPKAALAPAAKEVQLDSTAQEPQADNAEPAPEGEPEMNGEMTQKPKEEKPEPIKRRTYGGTLHGGKFHKANADTIDDLTEDDKRAILEDIVADRQKRAEALAKKQRKHETRKKKETEKVDKFKEEMEKAEQAAEERRQLKVKELKKWLKKKEDDARAKREKEEAALREIMEKEATKKEKVKLVEQQRAEERTKRLRVAERNKAKLQEQLARSKEAPSGTGGSMGSTAGMPGMPTGAALMMPNMGGPPGMMPMPGLPPGAAGLTEEQLQRIIHRHVHHHVHYHEGSDEDEGGQVTDPMQQSLQQSLQGPQITARPGERRTIEMAAEARVRAQLEAQQASGQPTMPGPPGGPTAMGGPPGGPMAMGGPPGGPMAMGGPPGGPMPGGPGGAMGHPMQMGMPMLGGPGGPGGAMGHPMQMGMPGGPMPMGMPMPGGPGGPMGGPMPMPGGLSNSASTGNLPYRPQMGAPGVAPMWPGVGFEAGRPAQSTMRRPASLGAFPGKDDPSLARTQEAFKGGFQRAVLPPVDAARRRGLVKYAGTVERAIGSYADTGRPRYGRASAVDRMQGF